MHQLEPPAFVPLHVLTLTPFYPSASDGASGCFVAEPLRAVSALGVANSTVAAQPFYRGRISAAEDFPAHWVRYLSFPGGPGLSSSGAFLFARVLPLVRQLHRRQPISVIHAHGPLPCGHTAALLGRSLHIPFVVTVHGLDAYATRQVPGLPGQWCRRVSRMVYRSAARVICISEKVRQQVLQGAAGSVNTSVVYNGTDTSLFSPAKERDSSGAVLSVGNLIPIKGHETLLRALAATLPDFPETHWQIIGDGPERPRLAALAGSLGIAERVHFLGRLGRREVADALRRCSLFALPSSYEGLGCAYLEAMAAGKPVIACRGQGIEEVIQEGANSFLIDPGDKEELARLLRLLLSDSERRASVGAAARATILAGFTLVHQAGQLADLYRECSG